MRNDRLHVDGGVPPGICDEVLPLFGAAVDQEERIRGCSLGFDVSSGSLRVSVTLQNGSHRACTVPLESLLATKSIAAGRVLDRLCEEG